MAYKTILVRLEDQELFSSLMNTACALARRFQAHLIGLNVKARPMMPAMVSVDYGEEILRISHESWVRDVTAFEETFNSAVKEQPLIAEWRAIDTGFEPYVQTVLTQCRSADLVVVPQEPDFPRHGNIDDRAERLALDSGRPVLVVPRSGEFSKLGDRILVAWDGSREAARAAFDALPMLQVASAVEVLSITTSGSSSGDPLRLNPCVDIAASLARHGVTIGAAENVSTHIPIGDELLNRVSAGSFDTLVMGCYGHSRTQEWFFGGATRRILQNMTVPVLLSH